MKTFKTILIIFLVLAALIGAALYYGFYRLDDLAKTAIEKYGSEAIATKLSVESVSINLKDGNATIKNLAIANPKGFADKDAIYASLIKIDLDTSKTTSELVVIKRVLIDKPKVYFEKTEKTDNLSVLQKNADDYSKKMTKELNQKSTDQKKAQKSKGDSINLQINNIDLNGVQVHYRDPRLLGNAIELAVPNIHIAKIETGKNGTSSDEISGQVMEPIMRALRETALGSLTEYLNKALKGLGDGTKTLEQTGKDALQSIKNIFK